MATREGIIAELKKRGYKGPEVQAGFQGPNRAQQGSVEQQPVQTPQQPQNVQPQGQNGELDALIAQALGRGTQTKNVGHRIGDALSILGGGQAIPLEAQDNDLQKSILQEAVKAKFRNNQPTNVPILGPDGEVVGYQQVQGKVSWQPAGTMGANLEKSRQQGELAGAKTEETRTLTPFKAEDLQAKTGLTKSTIPLREAQTEATQAMVPVREAQTKMIEARSSGGYLTPALQKQKNDDTENVMTTITMNNLKKENIDRALKTLPNLPQGFLSKEKIGLMRQFDSKNPILGDWQNLKSVLTDSQLLFTAKSKGAISDREMALFAQASANDDIITVAGMGDALNRLSKFIDTQNKSSLNSYKQIWKEDPMQFEGMQQFEGQPQQGGGGDELSQIESELAQIEAQLGGGANG